MYTESYQKYKHKITVFIISICTLRLYNNTVLYNADYKNAVLYNADSIITRSYIKQTLL